MSPEREARDRPPIGGLAFAAFLALTAFSVDPGVHRVFATPRLAALGVGSALLAMGWSVHLLRLGDRARISFSAIEWLLGLSILWKLATSPGWTSTLGVVGFRAQLALLTVTLVTRQYVGRGVDDDSARSTTRKTLVAADAMHALWICATAQAVLGLAQAVAAGAVRYDSGPLETPMVGALGSPNSLGAFLALGAMASGFSILSARSLAGRIIPGMALLVIATALLANGSRGAVLGGAAGCLAVYLATRRWKRGPLGTAIEGRATAMIARRGAPVVLFLSSLVVLGATLHALDPDSGRGRIMVWEITADMIGENPTRGVGAGSFDVAYPPYQAAYFDDPDHQAWTHKAIRAEHAFNEYLSATAESGIPGGVLFILPWVLALSALLTDSKRESDRARWLRLGGAGVLIGLLVHASVDAVLAIPSIALTGHVLLGFAPMTKGTVSVRVSRRVRIAMLGVALGYAAFLGASLAREYPARQLWLKGLAATGTTQAATDLQSAAEALPGEGEVLRDLGNALLAADDPGGAIVALQAARNRTGDPNLHLDLAGAYLRAGEPTLARLHADSARSIFPDRLAPHLALAHVYRVSGDDDRAMESLARVINKETRVQSATVDSLADEATTLWTSWYGGPPPRAGARR